LTRPTTATAYQFTATS